MHEDAGQTCCGCGSASGGLKAGWEATDETEREAVSADAGRPKLAGITSTKRIIGKKE